VRRACRPVPLGGTNGPDPDNHEAMTVVQDIGLKWQTAYNSGEAGKVADLYDQEAVFSSGVLGTLKGKPEIEKAVADQMKKTPKITVNPTAAHQNGDVVWGYGDFMFPDGPSGHYGSQSSTTRVRGMSPCTFLT
jgi:ketosteroid isomerase-like protein